MSSFTLLGFALVRGIFNAVVETRGFSAQYRAECPGSVPMLLSVQLPLTCWVGSGNEILILRCIFISSPAASRLQSALEK